MVPSETMVASPTELNTAQFRSVLRRQFSSVVTGQKSLTPGNYATYTTEDKELDLSLAFVMKSQPHVLAVNIKAGVTDGFAALLTDREPTTGASLGAQYHMTGSNDKQALTWSTSSLDAWRGALSSADAAYNEAVSKADNWEKRKSIAQLELLHAEAKRKKLEKKLEPLQRQLQAQGAEMPTQQRLLIDSLTYALVQQHSIIEKLEAKQAGITHVQAMTDRRLASNARIVAKSNVVDKLEATGFHLEWWSWGGKVRYDAFNLFDGSLSFENQIKERDFLSYEASLQRTIFHVNSWGSGSYYLALNATYRWTNNLSALSTTTLEQVSEYGPNAGDRRSISKTEVYAANAYKADLHQGVVLADLYWLMDGKNRLALHVNPSGRFTTDALPIWNVWCGLVAEVKKKDDTKSVLNVELAYNLVDFFGVTKGQNNDLRELSAVGVNVSVPIAFPSRVN